jgi:hypothetical protein
MSTNKGIAHTNIKNNIGYRTFLVSTHGVVPLLYFTAPKDTVAVLSMASTLCFGSGLDKNPV